MGNPTVNINNAGKGAEALLLPKSAQDSPEGALARLEKFQSVLDINLIAHLRMNLGFAPYMIKRNHGHIVTMASLIAFLRSSPSCEYAASKVAA